MIEKNIIVGLLFERHLSDTFLTRSSSCFIRRVWLPTHCLIGDLNLKVCPQNASVINSDKTPVLYVVGYRCP